MRAQLSADSGFAGLITKNPSHPLWRVLYGPRTAYELGELTEYLPGIEKHIPRRGPVEEVGVGRNITVFDWLRHLAYRQIRHYKTPGTRLDGWNAWLNWCNCRALERNGEFSGPLDPREVWHIARSVAKWTWRRFDIEASDARFARLQSERGKRGGLAKGMANEGKRASARLMAAQGYSVRAIAQALEVSFGSVSAWCSDSHNQITAP